MPELNPVQLEQWGDLIRINFDVNPELLQLEKNPKPIPDEADVDLRVWYPLDENYTPNRNAHPEAYYVIAEWVNTWPIWW
jgi:hypothetical protein